MNSRTLTHCTIGAVISIAATACTQKDDRPNIIVILADDLGYSDLGCYGGEIQTPNLDRLAENGLRFTRFYNTGRSCPTRASLLTGLYQHQAGIGRMTFDQHLPGYRGQLSDSTVTIAEVMKDAGYNTGMVGKWHVAETPLREDQREWLNHQVSYPSFADLEHYPTRKGFDSFYGVIYGVVNFFDPFSLVNGETPISSVPKDYYITTALNDTATAYVNRYANEDKPFFIYLAHTAPHWPLHALPEDIAKYEEVYKVGWEAIRQQRYERMKELGLFDASNSELTPRPFDDSWEENSSKEWDAHAMAVHAAMVDRLDKGLGNLFAALEKNGQWENTLILFLSDNGCSSEDCQLYEPGENDRPDMTRDGQPIIYPKNKEVLPGPETSFASVGARWANVANTPFRFWKARQYEGGICTPMIAHWPKGIQSKGEITTEMGHVMDIMATCVDLGKTKYPTRYQNREIIAMEGKSLCPIFEERVREGHPFLGFEHFGEQALIAKEGWKIVRPNRPDAEWELYQLNTDRTEMHNLASSKQAVRDSLITVFNEWAERSKVVPAPK